MTPPYGKPQALTSRTISHLKPFASDSTNVMTTSALHKSFDFSTRQVRQHQRAEWYSHHFSSTFFPMRAWAVDDQPFSIDMSIHSVRDINISFNTVSAHRAASTRAQTSNANDAVMLGLKLSGNPSRVNYNGEGAAFDAGHALLFRTTGAVDYHIPSDGTSIYMQLAPQTLRQIAPKLDLKGCRQIEGNLSARRLLLSYLQTLRSETTISNDIAHVIHTHLIDLAALTIGTTPDMEHLALGRGAMAARLKVAREFIRDNLLDPQLDDELVARHLGVSPRYVRKLFEQAGIGGCAAYIKLQRLERARRMLTSPLYLDRKIIDIAFQCGFDDISTFNRRFRAAFGATPSDVRQLAFDVARSANGHSDPS